MGLQLWKRTCVSLISQIFILEEDADICIGKDAMVVCAVEGKDHVAQEAEVFLQKVVSFLGLFRKVEWGEEWPRQRKCMTEGPETKTSKKMLSLKVVQSGQICWSARCSILRKGAVEESWGWRRLWAQLTSWLYRRDPSSDTVSVRFRTFILRGE